MTAPAGKIVDLFAGPRGWSEGLATLGLGDVGLERDPAACATAVGAGHPTVLCDVAEYPPEPFRGWDGLIASPPCQAFSAAGKRAGHDVMPELVAAIEAGAWDSRPDPDPRVWLVLEVGRWVDAIRPRWVACEQVPGVLPLWRAYERALGRRGYASWSGLVHSEQFGLPQTRTRAVLVASLDGVRAPAPTHQRWRHGHPPEEGGNLFGALEPWVSMADGLGWPPDLNPQWWELRANAQTRAARRRGDQPAPTITASMDNGDTIWIQRGNQEDDGNGGRRLVAPRGSHEPAPTLTGKSGPQWVLSRPATTVCGDERLSPPGHHEPFVNGAQNQQHGPGTIKLTEAEGLLLQGFRADYPVVGTKAKRWEQIGNAFPPPVAAAVVAAALRL